MKRRTRNSRGVTLVEVMAVLGIALIMTMMGMSNLSGTLQATRERRYVDEIRGHLEEGRSLARSLLSPVTVSVGPKTITLQSASGTVRAYTLNSAVTSLSFDSATGTLTFNASGGTDLAGPVTLTVKTSRNLVYRLKVFPAIGVVRQI